MKIAINSPNFLPRIGGLENVTAMLAGHFARRGHEVRVLTTTPADAGGEPELGFTIIRDPQGKHLWSTAKWCDVFVHSNISLKAVHPLLLLRKPWMAIHHGWYSLPEKPKTFNAITKCQVARFAAVNVAVSQAVADYVGVSCHVIHNPYDDSVFKLIPEVTRDRELLFVGRLVSDKAPGLLVEAMGELGRRGIKPRLTIVGEGPEALPLRDQVKALGLEDQVRFSGALTGGELAAEMNAHRILVVPSTIHEGFGIVALEGIACGCVVIAADAGGLPEAIGPCGVTFRRGDPASLASCLIETLGHENTFKKLRIGRDQHVAKHTISVVGDAYLAALPAAFQPAVTHR